MKHVSTLTIRVRQPKPTLLVSVQTLIKAQEGFLSSQRKRHRGKNVNNSYKQKPHKKVIMLKCCKLTAGFSTSV